MENSVVPAVLWATQLYQPLWETVVLQTAIVLVVSKRQPLIWGGVCVCVCVCQFVRWWLEQKR